MNENSTIFAFNLSEDGLGTPSKPERISEKNRETSVDGDGPVHGKASDTNRAGRRNEGKASGRRLSLGGIDLVEFILIGAVFYFYGEKAVARRSVRASNLVPARTLRRATAFSA